MNLILEEAIRFYKKMGQPKTANLIQLAYNLGFTEGQHQQVPEGLKDAYEQERWVENQ